MANGMAQKLVAVAAMSAAALCGCWSGGADVWVAGPMAQLTDASKPSTDWPGFTVDSHEIRLGSGANETVSFQLVIDADRGGADGISLDFSDLSGPPGPSDPSKKGISAEAITPYRMWAVNVSRFPVWYILRASETPKPCGFYDLLTPFDSAKLGEPFKLPPYGRLAVWVDLAVPNDALPGLYTGRVAVKSGPSTLWTANIELKVYDFVLPDAQPIAAVGGFDYRTVFSAFVRVDGKAYAPDRLDRRYPPVRRGLTMVRQLMTLAHAHRLDLFDRGGHPLVKRQPNGSARLDWTDYDAIVTPYLTGSAFDDRIGCAVWPAPLRSDWPDPANYGGADSKAYLRLANEVIASCRRHFAGIPAAGQRIFFWPYRGPVNADGYRRHAALARIIRRGDPRTPILTEMPSGPAAPAGWARPKDFDKLFDISAPPARWLARPAAADRPTATSEPASGRSPLTGTWLTLGWPPYSPPIGILAMAGDVRAGPWLAMKYRCPALFIPDVLGWDQPADSPGPGQVQLFYPGTVVGLDEVLPSVRLKRLRMGMQDAARLRLLSQRQRPGLAAVLVNAMARYAGTDAAGDNGPARRADGWVTDPKLWYEAERLLAGEVQSAVHPDTYTGRDALTEQLAWRRFDRNIHTVQIERVVATVLPGERAKTPPASPGEGPGQGTGAAGPAMRGKVTVDLFNQYGRSVDVSAALSDLPPGWRPVKGAETIDSMPAGCRRTIELTADGPGVPPAADGKMPIGLTVTAAGKSTSLRVEAPFIRARAPAGAITIDGKLDDWPMRAGGSAGAFKLVGKRGTVGSGLARRQTLALVLRDRNNLYVAFRCREPNPAAMFMQADNAVRYRQSLAVGQDLVELVLACGSQPGRTEPLYHVVVKANGITIAERGTAAEIPSGRARCWPAGLRSAVGVYADHWVAELSIPLSAFGPDADRKVWRVNFARFATQGAEASGWSAAAGYFYNPDELGTMIMAPD